MLLLFCVGYVIVYGMNAVEAWLSGVARELGFVALGIAAAGPSRYHRLFQDWLRAGYHGEMRYLERHAPLRADPCLWIPGTRSIIVAAMRYPVNPAPGDGGFSALAWGRDYHDVLRTGLRELGHRLRERTGAGILRVGVDAVPLAEREWAVRAGLGWIGRQGQLVNPLWGCCLVLGEILTDLELIPGTVEPNRCGDCRRCLEACPTGALLDGACLDARRCLAYLTVEQGGRLPAAPAAAGQVTLFGCDRCTAVCPWNAGAGDRDVPEALRPLPGGLPGAAACRGLTDAEFHARFAGTALARGGLVRLRRNAAWTLKEDGT